VIPIVNVGLVGKHCCGPRDARNRYGPYMEVMSHLIRKIAGRAGRSTPFSVAAPALIERVRSVETCPLVCERSQTTCETDSSVEQSHLRGWTYTGWKRVDCGVATG